MSKFIDWRDRSIEMHQDDYDVIMVPKGTILYVGTSVKYPDDIIVSNSHYYSNLNTALHYAFSSDYQSGEFGKVILIELIEDIFLFDVSKPSNFKQLRSQFTVDKKVNSNPFNIAEIGDQIPMAMENIDVLKYSFGDGSQRCSHYFIDIIFCLWFKKNIKLNGWGLKNMTSWNSSNWHDEIMISDPQKYVKRMPFEYRLKIAQNQCILTLYLTEYGLINQKFPVEDFYKDLFTGVRFGESRYKGDPSKKSDQYLFLLENNSSQQIKTFQTNKHGSTEEDF